MEKKKNGIHKDKSTNHSNGKPGERVGLAARAVIAAGRQRWEDESWRSVGLHWELESTSDTV